MISWWIHENGASPRVSFSRVLCQFQILKVQCDIRRMKMMCKFSFWNYQFRVSCFADFAINVLCSSPKSFVEMKLCWLRVVCSRAWSRETSWWKRGNVSCKTRERLLSGKSSSIKDLIMQMHVLQSTDVVRFGKFPPALGSTVLLPWEQPLLSSALFSHLFSFLSQDHLLSSKAQVACIKPRF